MLAKTVNISSIDLASTPGSFCTRKESLVHTLCACAKISRNPGNLSMSPSRKSIGHCRSPCRHAVPGDRLPKLLDGEGEPMYCAKHTKIHRILGNF